MEQIIRDGSVTRGWVGIEVQDLSPELAESFELKATEGALIAGVLKGGPADRAGVKPGDVLLQVNSKPVTDSSSLLNLIAALKPGEQAMLAVSRKKQTVEFSVKVEKRPPQPRQPEEEAN
jgi:serine protease DegQ